MESLIRSGSGKCYEKVGLPQRDDFHEHDFGAGYEDASLPLFKMDNKSRRTWSIRRTMSNTNEYSNLQSIPLPVPEQQAKQRPASAEVIDRADFNVPKFHPDELPNPTMTATTPATKRTRAKSLGAIFGQAASNNNPRLMVSHARSRMSAPLIDGICDQASESETPAEAFERGRSASLMSGTHARIEEELDYEDLPGSDGEDLHLV